MPQSKCRLALALVFCLLLSRFYPSMSPMPNAKILIVEDEAIVAEDLSLKLEHLGYEICATTARGEEAIVLAHERHPDLVLMDIHLQGSMDGIQAAETIRKDFD